MEKKEEFILLKTTTFIKEYDDTFKKHLYSATGFFCKDEEDKIYLVTNYHVIKDSVNYMVYLTMQYLGENNEIIEEHHEYVPFTLNKDISDIRINEEYDLCAIYFNDIYNGLIKKRKRPKLVSVPFHSITNDFSTFNYIEKIMMIGYPNEVINYVENLPVVREGITATGMCEEHNGKSRFIINVPVYHGSSGSPVYYLNSEGKLCLVGIVSHFYKEVIKIYDINDTQKVIGKAEIPNGLGLVIKANVLISLLKRS